MRMGVKQRRHGLRNEGVVTAVVATTPIAMTPLVLWADKEHPRPMSVAGAVIAVAGVLLLLKAQGQW